jgi:hypothetical protein
MPNMNTRRIVAEWVRDSTIGFVLIVGGVTLADLVDLSLGSHAPLLSLICFCVSLVPFFWFAKRKGVIAFDLLHVVAWFAFVPLLAWLLSYPSVAAWLHDHEYYSAFLFPITVLGPIWLYRSIRKSPRFGFRVRRRGNYSTITRTPTH